MFSRFALAGLVFFGLINPCGAARLSFMEFSEISTERIRLADIAKVKGDVAGVAELLNLDLGQAPYPGRIDRVKASSVMTWIKRRLPQFEQLQWEGPAEVMVRTREHTIQFDEVAEFTHKTIVTRLGALGKEIELDAATRKRDLVIPDRAYRVIVTHMDMDQKCQRLATITQVVADGRVLASLPLQFLLATAAQEAGSVAGMSQDSDVNPATDTECNKIRQTLSEQQEASRNALAIRQLSPVTVELRTAGLTLETSGIALGNAGVGDLVRVRPPEGSGQYLARVLAPGRVYVTTGTTQ